MQFENRKVVLFHGVADLRKGAVGLLAFVGRLEPGVWYFFSNRSRSLSSVCVEMKVGFGWRRNALIGVVSIGWKVRKDPVFCLLNKWLIYVLEVSKNIFKIF